VKYSAVLFDLDGTLLNTIGDIAGAMNHALEKHGYPTHPDDAYYGMVGWGLDELCRRALPEGEAQEELIRELEADWKAYYHEHPADRTTPYDGVEDLLSALVEANISLGVLSNKPDELVRKTVEKLLPSRYFAAIRGQSEEFPHKPDPSSLLDILREIQVDPAEACLVGDSEIDMETARNAGIGAVAVSWGFRSLETLRKAGAEVTVHSTLELRRYLLDS
jgi:phosphoglycolate phosphatase